ncbi:MAG: nucleotidyltransferase [Clostridium sp.]|jgi:predicted nucleotidyltransferase|nr:nucleotidyltransferase [Clostridium sp.]
MNVSGIIAEYNPFHNGHKYHLQESKKATSADYMVIVMSGNFTQRGEPAILNKFARAEMALQNGADLVLELPFCYSVGSAEFFAAGGVTLLDRLNVVDSLCFGSECGRIDWLEQIARILLEEPKDYRVTLKEELRKGNSYPAARSRALTECFPTSPMMRTVPETPNNILGIEYLKCLLRRRSPMKPFTLRRMDSDYHDKLMGEYQSSALALRQAIFGRQDIGFLQGQVPDSAYGIIKKLLETARPIHTDDFSLLLHYKLLNEAQSGYESYWDVTPALSDRIRKNLYKYTKFSDFCELLKCRDLTYTRISRCLLHILCNLKGETARSYQTLDYVPYARVLGFREQAAGLLRMIKEKSSVPLIGKLADADKRLSGEGLEMLKNDIAAANIYGSIAAAKSGQPMQNEYTAPLIKL